jgi:hypothetical protein
VRAVERTQEVAGIVVMQADGQVRYAETGPSHAPWITAFDAESLTDHRLP